MEPKKNPGVDLGPWRVVFFEAGLVVALGIIVAAFNWNYERRPVEVVDWQAMLAGEQIVDAPWQEQLNVKPIAMQEVALPPVEGSSDELKIVEDNAAAREEEDIAAGLSLAEADLRPLAVVEQALKTTDEGQQGEASSTEAVVVDEIPRFMGGDPSETFRKWTLGRLAYPSAAAVKRIAGVVVVAFIIEVDGTLTGHEAIFSADPALSAEALRVVRLSPPWEPAKRNGEPIKMRYIQPIEFGLAKK
ncbi:MAG: energy transducer TonB [Rikenellaceae bacterium]|jgi:protein TonB|nr:energy transducer TonB [Rikenellaceae bacterium]